MAIIADTLAQIKSDPLALLGGADRVNQCFANAGHVWRDRVLTPAVTMKLFILPHQWADVTKVPVVLCL